MVEENLSRRWPRLHLGTIALATKTARGACYCGAVRIDTDLPADEGRSEASAVRKHLHLRLSALAGDDGRGREPPRPAWGPIHDDLPRFGGESDEEPLAHE
jgi:hypothetical protein